jgi:hypothetical protein
MSADVTSLPVEFLFNATIKTEVVAFIANGPQGTRVVVNAGDGIVSGPKLNGTVIGPGGDWLTMRANGVGQLDVRVLILTDDGAHILMTYKGILTDGGAHLRTAPQFETGAEQYAWLNDIQCIATGNTVEGGVSYDVYALR